MHTILYIDFDNTLFETKKFKLALWAGLAKKFDIDYDTELDRTNEFYEYNGDLHSYNFFRHIDTLRLDRDSVATTVYDLFRNHEFLYHDALQALGLIQQTDLRILTYGEDSFQRLKISLCPDLDHIPVETTLQDKGSYIEENHHGVPIILVDDKDLRGSLPSNVRFIHLDRVGEVAEGQRRGETIHSLGQLKGLL